MWGCKMKRKVIFLLILLVVMFLTGCASSEKDKGEVIETIVLNADKKENLKNEVIQCKANDVDCGDYSVSMVGFTFNKSSGDAIKDLQAIGTGLVEDNNSVSRGFDFGFKNSSDKEIAKKDAYLCIYLKYSFKKPITQRDSVISKITTDVTDNLNQKLSFIHNSIQGKYINIDYPYQLIVYKGFYDTKNVIIILNQTKFKLDIDKLNK